MTGRVLITGADGFVGRHLASFLARESGVEVLGLDLRPPRKDPPWDRCEYGECDILDRARRRMLDFCNPYTWFKAGFGMRGRVVHNDQLEIRVVLLQDAVGGPRQQVSPVVCTEDDAYLWCSHKIIHASHLPRRSHSYTNGNGHVASPRHCLHVLMMPVFYQPVGKLKRSYATSPARDPRDSARARHRPFKGERSVIATSASCYEGDAGKRMRSIPSRIV
jgi:hypothetical protein